MGGWLDGVAVTGSAMGKRPRRRKKKKAVYTVIQVAKLLDIDKSTVYKYLSTPEIIDPKDWFKLPGGEIRIRAEAINKLTGGIL